MKSALEEAKDGLRLLIAEILLGWAFDIAPKNSRLKKRLAYIIVELFSREDRNKRFPVNRRRDGRD